MTTLILTQNQVFAFSACLGNMIGHSPGRHLEGYVRETETRGRGDMTRNAGTMTIPPGKEAKALHDLSGYLGFILEAISGNRLHGVTCGSGFDIRDELWLLENTERAVRQLERRLEKITGLDSNDEAAVLEAVKAAR